MTMTASDVERQRFEHLVLDRPRPKADVQLQRPKGMPKAEWKLKRAALRDAGVRLAPGIEERVALRESWRGVAGTPETLEHSFLMAQRAGALARLCSSGTIDAHQLAAAQEIAESYNAIGASVAVRTASWDTAVDSGFRPELAGVELTAGVVCQIIYGRWRREIEKSGFVLDMIVGDVALTTAARAHRVSDRRGRALLIAALDRWIALRRRGARPLLFGEVPQREAA